jgi:hypothetical protein
MNHKAHFEISIDGGLGNQLFKFYAGLYFSKKYGMQPVFEISRLADIANLHPGENIQTLGLLDGFATKSNHSLNPRELRMIIQSAYSRRRANFKSNSAPPLADKQKSEIGYIEFNQSIKPDDLKNGYFQSWRYFDALETKPKISYQSLIRPTTWLEQKMSLLAEIDPLVMHVRRGDYQLTKNRKTGCLSSDYYRSIKANVLENNEIWIFTDSPKKVRDEFKNFGMKICLIEPPPESDPVESMILMSNASKIVISNSTFSWWAAKLAHSGTSVYAPSKWFEGRPDPTDLIPPAWERVDSQWVTQQNLEQY